MARPSPLRHANLNCLGRTAFAPPRQVDPTGPTEASGVRFPSLERMRQEIERLREERAKMRAERRRERAQEKGTTQ
ncbi:hypothetical protein GCM10009577_47190 [Streptomyces javensis]